MLTIFNVIHLILAIALIVMVLIQRGKGADIGASFGGGASSTVFGSQGSASFLTRTTAALATLFFITSLTLTYLYSSGRAEPQSVTEMSVPAQSVVIDETAGMDVLSTRPRDVPMAPPVDELLTSDNP